MGAEEVVISMIKRAIFVEYIQKQTVEVAFVSLSY